ncbi:FAD:protein FMN transferase [Acutalibacter caecimuris]|uniref:FAD:protein FMN transferase n=1 Tax=Acutalibacter caecimuris TaxID=3093657 RepID=UPI002AC8A9EB|nr:FAD:protein FMN transferase [Acutalibacter sp. M00118]
MTKKRKARLLLAGLFLLLLMLALALLWVRQHNTPRKLETFAMGAYVQQTVWGPGNGPATEEAAAAVAALENSISWRREGDIAGLNAQAGLQPTTLSPETYDLLETALSLCEKSGGAFDVTIGPVSRLWEFDSNPHLPQEEALSAALALVDYNKLLLGEDAGMAFLPVDKALFDGRIPPYAAALAGEGMAVDLGAIGKGAACDTAIAVYQDTGVKAAVITVGGSVGLWGQKPDGKPFRVSVRNPEGGGSLGVLELSGGFVSTSGSYEKFFEQDGQTYCHLLDPRTGYPAQSGLVSVTVWADSGALSDGLATACFVLGLQDSLPLLEAYGAQAVFVDEAGTVTVTPGWYRQFTLTALAYTLTEAAYG